MSIAESLNWRLVAGNETEITPETMKRYSCRTRADGTLERVWQGRTEGGEKFEVTAVWTHLPSGLWEGRLSWKNYQGKIPVAAADFPWRTVPFRSGSGILYGGMDTGLIYPADIYLPGRFYEQEKQSIMLLAFLNGDRTGHYFDVHDPDGYVSKTPVWQVHETGKQISGGFRHRIGFPEGTDGEIPYPVTAGDFRGGWYEAGQLYKPWAIHQKWYTARKTVNPLRKIGIWVWNRGPAEDAVRPVIRLQEELPGIPVALDWYWWHHNPYDTDYPDFWPPREGEDSFRKTIAELREKGIYSQVYINGVCMDMDSASNQKEDLDEILIRADGTPQCYAFNQWNHHRLGWTCSTAARFQMKIRRLIRQLHDCGLSGQYMDQIAFSTDRCCYHPGHPHKQGGGTWVVQGWRDFLRKIREENPDFPLTSEACSEHFMDLFDGGIVCSSVSRERMGGAGTPVPLFTSIYHGPCAQAAFGNYALPDGIPPWDPLWPDTDRWKEEKPWHKLYPEVFYMEVIRDVIWGMQPMVCNMTDRILTDPEYAEIRRFILETARFYHANLDFLFDGTMEDPEGFHCEVIPVRILQRTIFTPEKNCREIMKQTPAVLHGIWRNPQGECRLFMGNITGSPQEWKYGDLSGVLPPHAYAAVTLETKHE